MSEPVWRLYQYAVERFGTVSTLVEARAFADHGFVVGREPHFDQVAAALDPDKFDNVREPYFAGASPKATPVIKPLAVANS